MRKLHVAHPYVKLIVYKLCKCLCINVSVNAGRALTSGNRTNLCARAAKIQSTLCHKGFRFGNFIKRNSNDLCGKSCGKYYFAVAVFLGAFGDSVKLVGSKKSCDRNNPA